MKKFLALVMALALLCSCFSFTYADTDPEAGGASQNTEQTQPLPDGATQTTCTSADRKHTVKEGTYTRQNATCKAAGKETYVCSTCGLTISKDLPLDPTAHAGGSKIDYAPQSCKQYSDPSAVGAAWIGTYGGETYDKCTRCQQQYTIYFAAAQHAPVRKAANDVKATCTTPGSVYTYCTVCGEEWNTPVAKIDHIWYKVTFEYNTDGSIKYENALPKYEVVKDEEEKPELNIHDETSSDKYYAAPTCTTEGKFGSTVVCSLCGIYYNGTNPDYMNGEVLPKLVHNKAFIESLVVGYDPEDGTCTGGKVVAPEVGAENGYFEKVLKSTDGYFGAGYGPIVYEFQPQTCEEDGFVKLTCKACQWTITLKIEAEEHSYRLASIKYADNEGESRTVKLGFKEEGRPSLKRAPQESVVYVVNYAEDIADRLLDTETLTAEEYNCLIKIYKYYWQKNYVEQKLLGDCTDAPIVHFVCINPHCERKVIDAAGWSCDEHDWEVVGYEQKKINDVTAVKYFAEDALQKDIAICTDYTVLFKCAHCNEKKSELKAGKGHKLDDNVLAVLTVETCSTPGEKLVECEYCTYNDIVAINPHKPEAEAGKDKILLNATCTTAGTMQHTCVKCQQTYTTVIPAAGHNWKSGFTTVPTCDKAGVEDKVCTACGIHAEGYPKTVAQRHVVDKIESQVNVVIDADELKEGFLVYTIKDCTKDAKITYTCKNCKFVVVEHAAHEAHVFTKEVSRTPAVNAYTKIDNDTCQYNESVVYQCKNCLTKDAAKIESEKLEHVKAHGDDDDGKYNGKLVYILANNAQGKCGETGTAYYLCKHCEQYFTAESYKLPHRWESVYDLEAEKWTYECETCGLTKEAVLDDPQYAISFEGITFADRTSGKGQITLKNDTNPTWILAEKYVYIRWTFKDAKGEAWVAEDTRVVDANGYFDAKGLKAPAGTSLTEMLVIVTDDANADSKMLGTFTSYGADAK